MKRNLFHSQGMSDDNRKHSGMVQIRVTLSVTFNYAIQAGDIKHNDAPSLAC